jgi:hypothetical protein
MSSEAKGAEAMTESESWDVTAGDEHDGHEPDCDCEDCQLERVEYAAEAAIRRGEEDEDALL